VDVVFKALADPTRRSLLDELFRADGQTLTELERRLPMTRFGVMKHLRQLEDAGLVTTKRRGREKLHFLNPVPIRLVHDRWVSKYAEPWAAALSGLKRDIEEEIVEKVFEVYIRTTPERLWEAITDSDTRSSYSFGFPIKSDWTPGGRYEMLSFDGNEVWAEGENLELEPPRRLVQTLIPHWDEEVEGEPATRITWEIEPLGDVCRLRVTHEITETTHGEVYGGWPMILSSLKSLLETGETLPLPGPDPASLGRPKRAGTAA
jgi:uncharacterized protein YndB with AHSA1/START domain